MNIEEKKEENQSEDQHIGMSDSGHRSLIKDYLEALRSLSVDRNNASIGNPCSTIRAWENSNQA